MSLFRDSFTRLTIDYVIENVGDGFFRVRDMARHKHDLEYTKDAPPSAREGEIALFKFHGDNPDNFELELFNSRYEPVDAVYLADLMLPPYMALVVMLSDVSRKGAGVVK